MEERHLPAEELHEPSETSVQLYGRSSSGDTTSGAAPRSHVAAAFGSPGCGEHRSVERTVSPAAQESLDWLRGYASTRINSRLIDERRTIPPYVVLDFGNRGLLGLQVPARFGGMLELSLFDALRVQRQLAAIDMTLGVFVGQHNVLGIRPVLNFAGTTLRERILPGLAAGRILAAFGYTEAGAGSNPFDIQATARQLGDGRYVLNATKVWTSSACWAGVIHVFANQVSADGRSLGQVAFCLPSDLPGIRQGGEALTLGLRGMVQNAVHFTNVHVDAEYMLGAAGGGLAVASDVMLAGRLSIAAGCVGGLWRALQLAGRYAVRRAIGGTKLIDSDLIRARLASMHAAARAAGGLVDTLAGDIDAGVPVPPEAFSAAKAACAEWLGESVDMAVQIAGGRGYIETNHLARLLRDARITRIFEGPTDTMLMHIGKRVLDSESPLFDYIGTRLGDGATATALRHELDRVRHWRQASGDVGQAAHRVAGCMATLHLVRACSRDAACRQWLDARIAAAAQGLAGCSAPAGRDALEQAIEDAALEIGDVEQTCPDEDRALDDYLCKEFR